MRLVKHHSARGAAIWAFGLALSAQLHAAAAHADPQVDIVLLRNTPERVAADLLELVDARVRAAFAAAPGARELYVAPVEYDEVQLAVGCADESVTCLTTIARAAQANAVALRNLTADERGAVHLRLLYFEPATARPPASAEISAPGDDREQLLQAIPAAVERVLGIGSLNANAQPPAPGPARGAVNGDAHAAFADSAAAPARVAPTTWIVLGTGAALLASGIALAVSASADYDEFRRSEISTRADADRARRDFDSLETRATWSSVLIPAGAAAMGVGAVLLGLDLSAEQGAADRAAEQRGDVRPFVAASGDGGAVGVWGRIR